MWDHKRLRLFAVLVAVGCNSEDPTEPSLVQQLTAGSYSLAYQDTGITGVGASWYRGTMEVLAMAAGDSVVVAFDVEREDLPRIHFQTEVEGYPFIPSTSTTHGKSVYFLTPVIWAENCLLSGDRCPHGQLGIHLATVADLDGNFCVFGFDVGRIVRGEPFARASACVIEKL